MSADGSSASDSGLAANPLLEPSPLLLRAPVFDRIRVEHYGPALSEGMRLQLAEVRAIADNPEPASFDNTIEALERSGQLLSRSSKIFFNLTETMADEALTAVQAEYAPRLAAHADAIHLDAALFARIDALQQRRAELGLSAEAEQLLQRYHSDFVRAGARLSDSEQALLRQINETLARLEVEYQEKLQQEERASAIVVDQAQSLAGLDEAQLAAAAAAAAERGLGGGFLLTLEAPSSQSLLASLAHTDVRQVLFEAATGRGNNANGYDTRGIVARMAQLRAERAAMLGYGNHAAYVLADEMAGTPEAVMQMLADVRPRVRARAEAEAAAMRAWMAEAGIEGELEPWDWAYRARQLRQARLAADESELRNYFELERVLQEGVFGMARILYGIEFQRRLDLPVYHPDVRVYEVHEADGSLLGLYYLDPFARPGKRGGAWMDSFVDQNQLLEQQAVVINVLNITRPAEGQPALLDFEEVSTLFHEFGHAAHGLFSQVRYPTLSGTNVPRDFVEFPSQFHEDFALQPELLARYARHRESGQALPEELHRLLLASRQDGQGFAAFEYLAAALLDMRWHSLPAGAASVADAVDFEIAVLKAEGVAWYLIPPRYRSTYFSHIWSGGYAAGYYAYLWSEVLAADAYAHLMENGGMTAENGQRYRQAILSRGLTADPMQLYLDYRGSPPAVEAMLKRRGLVD